jgi:S-adenosylmethionine hydrolase
VARGLVTPRRVTLLTDFGTRDGFVGAVKGVLASLAPDAVIDDVAHDHAAGDVRAAARAVARYWTRYPAGTVHLVVVDPGVGTERRALACSASGRFLVAPDNGVLTAALRFEDARCVRIEERRLGLAAGIAPTFHGRDLFAPAAAALATGRTLEEIGPVVSDPALLAEPSATRDERGGDGVVVAVDHFGNLTTNLPGSWCAPGDVIELAGRRLALLGAYGEAPVGEALALVDSEGWIEVAVRDGSAARLLGVAEGAPARLITR